MNQVKAWALYGVSVSVLSLAMGGKVEAQVTSTAATELEAVVVTAQRREERAVDVPVSIVSQSADQLARANITTTLNLGQVAPGVLIQRVGANAAPSIRGISTKVVGAGADPNVATYVDGFYQANPVALNRSLLDVASIEILRGPQGTLFGRNTTGGAILINTRKPSFAPALIASASVEGLNGRRLVGYGSIGLTDTLAVSFSGSQARSDGWMHNVGAGYEFPSAPQRSYYARARALFTPNDVISLDFSLETGKVQDGGALTFSHYAHPGTAGVFPLLHTDPRETSLSYPNIVKDRWNAAYLTASLDFGWAVLKSLTSARKDKTWWRFDLDGSQPLTVVSPNSRLPQQTITQEVNLTSQGDGRLQWIVGAFYYDDEASSAAFRPAAHNGAETKAWAIYADGTWRMTDQLFLTVGGRYSTEDKHCSFDPTPPLGRLGDCTGGDPNSTQHAFTPRAVVRYELASDTNVYGSFARGFKSGGFNIPMAFPRYKPEKITSLEVGFKTQKPRYRLDLSAFHYNYKDLQSTVVCSVLAPPVCPVSPGTFTTNAAKSTVYGAEGQFLWRATDRLRLDGGVAYLHARYDEFLSASAFAPLTPTSTPACVLANQNLCRNIAVNQNWSGQQLIRAPDWSGNISALYDIPTSIGTFEIAGNLSYVSDFQSDSDALPCTVTGCGVGLKPRLTVPAHTLADLTVTWKSLDKHLEASVYARNLFDKTYVFRTDGNTVGDYVIGGEPRVVGARLKYTY